MHCDACDRLLSDEEATARFKSSGEFVMMCKPCRKWLPPEMEIISRPDLRDKREEEPDTNDYFDLTEYDDDEKF